MKTQDEIHELIKTIIEEDCATNETYLTLFNEMYLIGCRLVKKELDTKFESIPVEVDDFTSTMYAVYIDTIRWFKMMDTNREKFVYYFLSKLKQSIINDCRTFTTNGHRIMNYVKCEDDSFAITNHSGYIDEKSSRVEQEILNRIFVQDYINELVGIQKKIVILKLKGYSFKEICKKLNCPHNTVVYEWKKAIEKPVF